MSSSVTKVTEQNVVAVSKKILIDSRPLIMGVLNVTPDSFSDGGLFLDPQYAIEQAYKLIADGADIIDIGAESTRPGAIAIDLTEELHRLRPVLQNLGENCPVPISVDTRKADVASQVLDWGVSIINDVSAMQFDEELGRVVANAKAGIVLMHMQGSPETMQAHCRYNNVVEEVKAFLQDRIEVAESYGISREQIIIDPGIGFGKNVEQNLSLLKNLSAFEDLGQPLLLGVSRKSFIGSVLDKPVDQRTIGTAAAVAVSVLNGAHIIRVHDVKEMKDVVSMVTAIKCAKGNEVAKEEGS